MGLIRTFLRPAFTHRKRLIGLEAASGFSHANSKISNIRQGVMVNVSNLV